MLPLTDVQWVLGPRPVVYDADYLTPMPADVVTAVLSHRRRSDAV